MMGLLLLMGGADYNVRSELFNQNEQGAYYDPTLSESARTWRRNLLTYSEQFDNGAWTKTGVTVTANQVADPQTGEMIGDAVFEVAAASVPRIAFSTTQAGQVTGSFRIKGNGRDQIRVVVDASGALSAYYTLTGSGTVTPASGLFTGTITSLGDGWYFCTFTTTAAGGAAPYIATASGGSTIASGDNTKGFLISRAQYELGSTPTTYQRITDFATEFKQAFPTHTLYTDSNGVTPAVAPGDQIGLVLDQRQGALSNLGPELVTNGGFDSDTWWVKTAGVTIASGVCQYTSVALNGGVYRTGFLTAGKFYAVDFTVSGFSSGGVRVYSGGNRTGAFSSNGTYRVIVLAGSTDASLIFEATATGTTLALDNISVREVPGNHAYQTSSGARPTLARVPFGGRRNLLTYSEQFDNGAWTKTGVTVTANQVADPQTGEMIGDAIFEVAAASVPRIAFSTTLTGQVTGSFRIKGNGRDQVRVVVDASGALSAYYTLTGSGTVTPASGSFTGTITALGDGWYYCTFTTTSAGGAAPYIATASGGSTIASGDNTKGFWLSRVQYELSSTATAYQRVGVTHDVTEAGQADCWALWFDGSDDHLIANAIDFTGTTQETRRNLISASENFGSPWTNWISAATYGEAGPEGRSNAATFTNVVGSGGANLAIIVANYLPSQPHVLTFWVKAGTASSAVVGMWVSPSFISATGTILSGPGSISGTGLIYLSGLTSSWTKVQVAFTAPASGVLNMFYYIETSGARTGLSNTLAQFQIDHGSTPTSYQPTGTDEMTVIAGVRKNTDTVAIIAELSTNTNSVDGSFYVIGGPLSGTDSMYSAASRGTTIRNFQSPSGYVAPITNVLSVLSDISGDTVSMRINGASVASNLLDQGNGNYGNHVFYIGRRAGSTLPFSGLLHHLIIRGALTSGSKLTGAEKLAAKKSGIIL